MRRGVHGPTSIKFLQWRRRLTWLFIPLQYRWRRHREMNERTPTDYLNLCQETRLNFDILLGTKEALTVGIVVAEYLMYSIRPRSTGDYRDMIIPSCGAVQLPVEQVYLPSDCLCDSHECFGSVTFWLCNNGWFAPISIITDTRV